MCEKNSAKIKRIVQIFAVTVLFFSMLLTCGMYIDVKINGSSSSLPAVPEHEKQILLKTASSAQRTYSDDLIEPVFVGISIRNNKICAAFDSDARTSLMNLAKPVICTFFSGEIKKAEFENESERDAFVSDILFNKNFLLVSFLEEIHSGAIVPCFSTGFTSENNDIYFGVKHIFLIKNSNDGSCYGVAFSKNGEAYLLGADGENSVDNFSLGEYDVSDGFSYFSFSEDNEICPVMTSSLLTNKYAITPLGLKFGKEKDVFWVKKLFDIFRLNSNFVKSYSSKNNTEIIYVDGSNELTINDEGFVEFSAETDGVPLENFLGYSAGDDGKYLFSDKILAVKNIVNEMNFDTTEHCTSIVGIDSDEKKDKLSVYLKYFVNGVALTEKRYDAFFEITGTQLTHGEFYVLKCVSVDDYSFCLNQKAANALFDKNEKTQLLDYYPVLEQDSDTDTGLYKVVWARSVRDKRGE